MLQKLNQNILFSKIFLSIDVFFFKLGTESFDFEPVAYRWGNQKDLVLASHPYDTF